MTQRVYALDGLRGAFAAAVLVYHYFTWNGLQAPADVANLLERTAIYAVVGFFVLSGASMYLAYASRPLKSPREVAAFFVKRFFRIAPLFYAVMAFNLYVPARQCLAGTCTGLDWSRIAANGLFLFGYSDPVRSSMVTAGWSIGIEWVFYATFPLAVALIALGPRRASLGLCLAMLAVLIIWNWYYASGPASWADYARFPAYAFYFAFGMWAAANRKLLPWKLGVMWIGLGMATFVGSSFLLPYTFASGVHVATMEAVLFGAISCALVYAACSMANAPPRLEAAMRWMGDVSFGVYLIHPPALVIVTKLGLDGWVGILVASALTLALAQIFFQVVERRAMALGSVLAGSISQGRGTNYGSIARPAP